MFRLRDGNDALPAALAAALRGRVCLNTALTAIVRRRIETARQRSRPGAAAAAHGRLRRRRAAGVDAAERAIRAGASRAAVAGDLDVALRPRDARAAAVRDAVLEAHRPADGLRHRSADRCGLGRQRTAGEQARHPQPARRWQGIERGERHHRPAGMARAREAAGMARHAVAPAARPHVDWDRDKWSKGGYAVFDTRFDPGAASVAGAPGRPDRLCRRAHEHALAGLHERRDRSGKRAALEVAVMAGLDYRAIV